MAIISFTNYKHGQTRNGMKAVMCYTMQDKKTVWEDQKLVTGVNCQPESAFRDFMITKRLWHKEDGVQFYHMVQSFPKGEAVDPVTAHAAALELANYFEGSEVLVCTHTDREHIHSHLVINSVTLDTGRKLHIASQQLQELRQRNDEVCARFGLPVFQPRQKAKTKSMTTAEYHTAARGQSRKLRLMNVINDCMRHAAGREEFIALMESEGYQVRWEKGRRNITYTTPSGWQCRDRLLFGDKYLKEMMEDEFRIRAEIVHGRADGAELSRARGSNARVHTATSASHGRGMGGAAGPVNSTGTIHGNTGGAATNALQSNDGPAHAGTGGETDKGSVRSAGPAETGWEKERAFYFSAHSLDSGIGTDLAGPAPAGRHGRDAGLADHLVRLGRSLECSQGADPLMDATTRPVRSDRKALKREKEKKIALGQKADDHEEQGPILSI